MAADEKNDSLKKNPTGFNALFNRNLDHILEMIFFPLDNASFKNCLEVCREWQSFLTSEEFQSRRSAFSQRLWLDTANLKHQLWHSDHSVPFWTTDGEEVAFLDGQNLNYIRHVDQVKVVTLPFDPLVGLRNMWILKNTIFILHGDKMCFTNKETLEISTFTLPVGSMDYHFVPTKGVMLRILAENESEEEGYSIWLAQISMEHRQESEWKGNFQQGTYIGDKDGCCFFARVDSFFPSSYFLNGDFDPDHYFLEARYTFSEDGSILMIVGREENGYLSVIALDRENTRLLRRTEVKGEMLFFGDGDNAYARANSRFIFLVHRRRLTIKNIEDGTNVREIELLPQENLAKNSLPAWHLSRDRIFLSEKFFIILRQKYALFSIEERELLMMDIDTFETRCQSINWFEPEYAPDPDEDRSLSGFAPNFNLFHERKLAVFTPNYINEDVNVHYHFDLAARNLDELWDGRGELTSMVKCRDEFLDGYESVTANSLEVCRGVYLLSTREHEIRFRNRGRQSDRLFYEVISWKSEELPPAMKKFFALAGITEGEDSLALSDLESSESESSESSESFESSGLLCVIL